MEGRRASSVGEEGSGIWNWIRVVRGLGCGERRPIEEPCGPQPFECQRQIRLWRKNSAKGGWLIAVREGGTRRKG